MEEIVYFEINNWFAGRDYPDDEIFCKWIDDQQFRKDECYCVAAPKSWVAEHCPKLLTDEEYVYKTATIHWDDEGNEIRDIEEHTKKYSDFLCHPDSDGEVFGHISEWEFPEYKEDNFGVTWNDSWWGDSDEDEEDDEDE